MSAQKKTNLRAKRRTLRVRKKFVSKGQKPRISVFRSLNQIYAQIIDDSTNSTLASYSSLVLSKSSGSKKDIAKQVGMELGKIALANNISEVFFDRGKYAYHGRVAALADGLRESGIKF